MQIVTKKELESEIITLHGKKIFTNSIKYSEEFGFNHMDTLKKIRNLTKLYNLVKTDFKESTFINERNREYPYYEMTRDGYMTLIMQMGGAKNKASQERIFEKQQMFIQAFGKMEEIIARQQNVEWLEAKSQGKIARREETDVIKEFVEYAFNQGSTNAKHYYSNITKATYKALGLVQQGKPKTRDTLDMLQTHQLLVAESGIRTVIEIDMSCEVHYKDIYQNCKVWLEDFASSTTYKYIE